MGRVPVGVVQGDLAQHPALRVHRRLPELGRVHLAEALEPLDRVVLDLAAGLGAEPEGAFYLFFRVDTFFDETTRDSVALCARLIAGSR